MDKKPKHRYVGLEKRKAIAGYLFILPFIIGFAFFMVKPFFQSLYMSFNTVELGAGKFDMIWNGFGNYVYAFRTDPEYARLLTEELLRMLVYSLAAMTLFYYNAAKLQQFLHICK